MYYQDRSGFVNPSDKHLKLNYYVILYNQQFMIVGTFNYCPSAELL